MAVKHIPLSQGKFATVDAADFPELSKFTWHTSERNGVFYASRHNRLPNGRSVKVYMHRQIANPPKDKVVDHVNGDGLDNRRLNLRVCNRAQNNSNMRSLRSTNTSGYVGVTWRRSRSKWAAQISHKGRVMGLGYFDDPAEAARVRDAKARELHGEFAFLNFPKENY